MGSYCRLCLEYGGVLFSISSEQGDKTPASLIEEFLTIKIDSSESEDISKVICRMCLETLDSINRLKECSIENHNYLISQHQFSIAKEEPEQESTAMFIPTIESSPTDSSSAIDPLANYQIKSEFITTKETLKREASSSTFVSIPPKKIKEDPLMIKAETASKDDLGDYSGEYDDELLVVDERKEAVKKEETPSEPDEPLKPQRGGWKIKRDSSFGCAKCGERFDTYAQVCCHSQKFHNDVTMPFKCNICNNQFKKKIPLNVHKKIHDMDFNSSKFYENGDPDKTRTCIECHQVFQDLATLEYHWDDLHSPEINPFSCYYCDVRDKTEDHIKQHLIDVHGELTKDQLIVILRATKTYSLNQRLAIFVNPWIEHPPKIAKRVEYQVNKNEASIAAHAP
jgi:hypothetical protein